VKSKVCSAFF